MDYFRIKPMPWKVFQQSLALTNSGEHRTRSFQNSVIMPSVAIAPKWGDSAFELFSLHLETHFEDIQEKTTHVNPSTPCYCVQNILYKHAVSGFVVSRMETKLEHGCLDIVTYLPFLKRDGLNSPANLGLVLLTWG